MFYYIVAAIGLAAMTGLARSRRAVVGFASVFFVMQAAFAVWSITAGAGVQSAQFLHLRCNGNALYGVDGRCVALRICPFV